MSNEWDSRLSHCSLLITHCYSDRREHPMIVLIDNYDTFTYNLYQYLCELGADVRVIRNDAVTVADVVAMEPERVVLSPGPCTPNEAGICVPLIHALAGRVPILGVCLGHQAIGAAYGGDVVRAPTLMHGKTSEVEHDGKTIFAGIPSTMTCTRYHSLIVADKGLPKDLEVSARRSDGGMVRDLVRRML